MFHGRYRVVRAIKSGAMGTVYEVVDDTTNAPRALKVMLPSVIEDADQRARFALEARVTGNIESDHLLRVFDAGIDAASQTPLTSRHSNGGPTRGSGPARTTSRPP